MKNYMEISFLKKDIDEILNNTDINIQLKKIMSRYDMMNDEVNNIINFNYENEKIIEIQEKKTPKIAMKSQLKLK